jgi:hypothetical protein
MEDTKEYLILEIIGNKRTKSGDQISEWLHPKVEEMKQKMNDWDWSQPFEFEMPEKSLISEFHEILKDNGLPDELPEVGKFLLFESSRLTDFIKGSFLEQYGLIVSEKAKTLLTKFNLGNHNYFPITILHKGIVHDNYFFLKCLTNSNEYVDCNLSDFYTQEGFFDKQSKKQIKFETKEEFTDFIQKTPSHKLYLFTDNIILNDRFPNFDLFKINDYGFNEMLVSKELANSLNKLTGITLTKTTKVK